MLKDIDIIKIPIEFNGEQRYLRYNMNSKLYMEYMTDNPDILQKNTRDWTFDDILHFLRAMLMDSFYEENKVFIENRDFMSVKPLLSDLGRFLDEQGAEKIMMELLKAVVSFLPESPIGTKATPNPHHAM